MAQELKVIADFYDFMLWLIRHTEKFPRHHRYGLGLATFVAKPLSERTTMFTTIRNIVLLASVCLTAWNSPARADVGTADSPVFAIDNRTGAGLRITALTPTYTGVFAEGVDVINTITATVDWAGKTPSYVVFTMNGGDQNLPTGGTSAQNAYNMGIELSYNRSGAINQLVVYAVAADGTTSPPLSLYFWGLALPEWAISLETMEDLGFRIDPLTGKLTFFGEVKVLQSGIEGTVTVPDSIPEVGGKWGVKINPLNFAWELAAQPRYGDGAGLTGTFDLSGSWGADLKAGTHRKGEVSATLSGAGEFYPQFKLTDVSAELAGSLTFLFPRVPLLCQWTGCCHTGYCPYFQASVKPEITGTVGMEEGEPAIVAGLKFENATLELGVTVAGTVGAGSEGSIYYIAGTIGGKPSITLQFPGDAGSSCLNEYIQEAAFDLEARFVVECAWWQIEQDWTFNLYTCPIGNLSRQGIPKATARVVTMVDRSYLSAPEGYSVFPAVRGVRSIGSLPDPIVNVGSGPMPALAATSDAGLLLFVYDDAGQPTGQHQEIYFAQWDGNEWTANAPLTVNSQPDLQPAATIDSAGKEIAVWVQGSQPTGTETGPRDVLPGFEIVYSSYDNGLSTWSAPQAVTNNSYVDMLPWFDKLPDGSLRACWISSATNTIPVWNDEEIAPSLDVIAADWDGAAFGTPYVIATNLEAVAPPSVTESATQEFLCYVKDSDDNSGTAEDREVVARVRDIGQAWGAEVQLTNDARSDTAVQVATDAAGDTQVVWVKRMVPKTLPDSTQTGVDQLWFSMWNGTAWSVATMAFETAGITEPKLIRNEAGKLVLFWVAASAEFSDVYYSVYDETIGQWGPPQQVTHDEGAETMLALTESDGNILAAYVKRRIDLTDPSGLPKVGLSDIYLMQHVPAKDLFVATGDISFNLNPIVPGQSADICANVHLSGDFTVADVLVNFYDGDPVTSGTLIDSTTLAAILPGGAPQACVTWAVPSDGMVHQVYVVVDPDDTIPETDDTTNNSASVSPFAPDLRISSPGVVAFPGPDTMLVGCTVRNDGSAEASGSTLEIRRDNASGPILYTTQIPSLAIGGSVSVQFAWDVTALSTGIYSLVFTADAGGSVSEIFEKNNVLTAEAAVRGDLQAESWSASVAAGNAHIVVRNVGAKQLAASVVRVVRNNVTLGEAPLLALDAAESADIDIAVVQPTLPGWLTIIANPDSDGSDEVTLLNNSVSFLVVPHGDIDGDGDYDLDDVSVFVSVLLGLETDSYRVAASDINLSGSPDGKDVQPFIDALLAQ
ncbi:MAG: hypothetical protein AMXMBFR16_12020 [Candidatus Uhrbacteria bacterium]